MCYTSLISGGIIEYIITHHFILHVLCVYITPVLLTLFAIDYVHVTKALTQGYESHYIVVSVVYQQYLVNISYFNEYYDLSSNSVWISCGADVGRQN